MTSSEQAGSMLLRLRTFISALDSVLLSFLNLRKLERLTLTEIDDLETKALEARLTAVLLVEEAKQKLGMEICHPAREEEELANMLAIAAARPQMNLDPAEIKAYFTRIFQESREAQKTQRRAAAQAADEA